MRGGVVHPPSGARRAYPAFTRERHEDLGRTGFTPDPRETPRQNAAVEVRQKLLLDEGGQADAVVLGTHLGEERIQVLLHHLVEDGALGLMPAIARERQARGSGSPLVAARGHRRHRHEAAAGYTPRAERKWLRSARLRSRWRPKLGRCVRLSDAASADRTARPSSKGFGSCPGGAGGAPLLEDAQCGDVDAARARAQRNRAQGADHGGDGRRTHPGAQRIADAPATVCACLSLGGKRLHVNIEHVARLAPSTRRRLPGPGVVGCDVCELACAHGSPATCARTAAASGIADLELLRRRCSVLRASRWQRATAARDRSGR